jgi:glycerol-3-phosphate acyltransferase PlsY
MTALLQLVLSYLLGSVLGSLVVGKLRGGVDIRHLGSGNPGSTNALRTQGKGFALAVIALDAGKGYVAAALLPRLSLAALPPAPAVLLSWMPAACAVAVLVGHLLPVWHGFRGGKGVATVGGSLMALSPLLFVGALACWVIALLASRYVSVASMLTAILLPVAALLLWRTGVPALLLYTLVAGLLVVVKHRRNIGRLRAGSEPRIGRPR